MAPESNRYGIVYLAYGDSFKREVRRSIASVRRWSPGLPVAVITDAAWAQGPRPEQFVIVTGVTPAEAKPRRVYPETPFDRTLLLDSDTVLARDVSPLFDLLDFYEFGLKYVGPDLAHEPGLRLHPYASSGILLFRKSENVRRLFELWDQAFTADIVRGDAVHGYRHGPHDRTLAGAVARSGARVVSLPDHALANLNEPLVLYAPPLVCHGRFADMERLAAYLVRHWTRRGPDEPLQGVWLPNIRGLLPSGLRRSGPLLGLSLVLQRLTNAWRRRRGGPGS